MVDHSVKTRVQLVDCNYRMRLSVSQTAKLESIMARSYSDDANIRHGALSAPSMQFRPGQRDDVANCSTVNMLLNGIND